MEQLRCQPKPQEALRESLRPPTTGLWQERKTWPPQLRLQLHRRQGQQFRPEIRPQPRPSRSVPGPRSPYTPKGPA